VSRTGDAGFCRRSEDPGSRGHTIEQRLCTFRGWEVVAAPLSEQEEMLVRYIRERPHEAALIAHAQAELLKQDREQFAPLLSAEPPSDSQP